MRLNYLHYRAFSMNQDSRALSYIAHTFYRSVGQHLPPHFQVTMVEEERKNPLVTALAQLQLVEGDTRVSVDFLPAMIACLPPSARVDWAKDAARELLRRWTNASQLVA